MNIPHDTDLYADLGLTHSASRADITRAYRALVRRHHPDTQRWQHPDQSGEPSRESTTDTQVSVTRPDPASGEAVNRALAAYAVLGDPARRADYDHHRRGHPVGGEQRTPPPATAGSASPMRFARGAPFTPPRQDPPPIQVGPVRWHGPVHRTTDTRP